MESAVVYLGHIPHGFYEEEMKEYFSQFGKVTRLKLSRSKRTGRSKGFAFIEFECSEVAKIVADTMNNYLMFNKLLKCQMVPSEKVHEGMFRISRLTKRPAPPKARTPEHYHKQIARLRYKDETKRKKLAKLGIDYDFPGYAREAVESPKITVFTSKD